MKLRTKIQLFSSLFMLILILLVNASIYYLFYQISAESELEQLKSQTDTMAEELANNPEVTRELIVAYLPTNGMARVFPQEGQPLEWHYRENAYTNLAGEFNSAESHRIVSPEDGSNVAVVTKPIIWGNGDVVTLEVSNHLLELDNTMTTLFYVLAIASVIILIPTVLAGNVLSRFLLNPITDLINTMKENTKQAKWKKIEVGSRSKDELYEMEKTFNEMIDRLRENFEKQEVFVSDASHELKTPISIVKSYAQLLKRRGRENPELFEESVEAIDSEADRMQKLVEQLLALAKNKNEAVTKQVDMTFLGEETIKIFQGAYDRDIQFQKPERAITVNGNPDQLEQIIYILIDNALKYSEDQVEVSLTSHNGSMQFIVTDFGPGIPKADQQRIFDRFYRLDKARSRETGGTGLGLAIAKAIASLHNGKLVVHSEEGKGSTFTLTLPMLKKD
ncbi:HAMP domain-containing sensor histidine kinase [Virgibacillus kimchii]